ncbi:hypothetical protein CVS40_10964 [Lucilia cuprina]|nr:hypothetical protein CVS40_10964 [Lucilia cuprina]
MPKATENSPEEIPNIEIVSNFENSEVDVIADDKNGTLRENIREWYIKYRPSVASTSAILHILNSIHSEIPLSVEKNCCPRLLCTPWSERNLLKIVDVIKKLHIKEIVLDIGIDGLPLFKSSSVGLWPILARIVNMPMINVFLIGSYVGIQKPHDINLFLHDFVTEMKNLIESVTNFALNDNFDCS